MDVRTTKRTAREGDIVRSIASGRLYLVTEVIRNGADQDRVWYYDADGLEDGLPYAFLRNEVQTVHTTDARRILAGPNA